MNFFISLITSLIFFFTLTVNDLYAVMIIRPVEITLRIEDADFKQKIIKEISFADKMIELEPATIKDFRKEVKFKLMPGLYNLKWTTQTGDISWVAKNEKIHDFIIEIEKKDQVVHIRVRGDTVSLY